MSYAAGGAVPRQLHPEPGAIAIPLTPMPLGQLRTQEALRAALRYIAKNYGRPLR